MSDSEQKGISITLPRLASIDAYRGFVMFLMMAEILRLGRVADAFSDVTTFWGDFWRFLAFHQSHVPWVGCSLHDMIQPSFTFIVGVALPFSIASRIAKGQSQFRMSVHAFSRAAVLILLGVFLRSIGASQTNWTFEDTLTQIGLGYGFLFLLGFRSVRVQIGVLVLVLIGYWAAFACYPLPGEGFDWSQTGVTADWEHNAVGFAAHWNKNTNPAWAFDTWFMNLFPRKSPFLFNGGGYSTLSFIPTFATMVLGLLAGTILRSEKPWGRKFGLFLVLGTCSLVCGYVLNATGLCPNVKRIWTPSWVLYSGGICYLILATFFLVLDVCRIQKPFFPFMVIGANSITAYCIADTPINAFIKSSLTTHFGTKPFECFGPGYDVFLLGATVLLIDWLILFWMYRKKIFVRI